MYRIRQYLVRGEASMNNQKSAVGGLAALLKKNGQARQYYASLPSYVQDLIGRRFVDIHSEYDLHRCADSILYSLSR